MATKLEYLQKYLAKPAGAAESSYEKPKDKKKKKKVSALPEAQTIQIRDLSEALPKPRALAEPHYKGHQAKLLSLDLDDDDKRLVIDGELDYVEEQAVLEARKIDVDKSGVRWKISNHKQQPKKTALRNSAASSSSMKAEVVKEVKEESSDHDLSPPRQNRESAGDLSPPRRPGAKLARHDSDADLSPPRTSVAKQARRNSDRDLSPPRTGGATQARHDSDVDLSPPRRPGTKQARHDSDADLSPPRTSGAKQARCNSDADLSPPRRSGAKQTRHDSDADLSPPRTSGAKQARHDSDADLSPPRRSGAKQALHDSDVDLSPPRRSGAKQARHDSDVDLSPPRRSGAKQARHDSDVDLSPPRKSSAKQARHDSDADLSPPRQRTSNAKGVDDNGEEKMSSGLRSGLLSGAALKEEFAKARAERKARNDSDADLSPPRPGTSRAKGGDDNEEEKMSSGLRSGLVSGAALKEEAAKVRAERKAALEALPDTQTGKNADTVYRNRQGGKIDRAEWVEQQQKKRKKKLSEYPEQELAWGGGLKQQSNKEEEMAETARVAALPFARFEPDEGALDDMHDKQAWHDPMSKFNDDEEETGRELPASLGVEPKQEVKKKPKCPHPPWPNRFGIPPGYRWDGAVRGNEYEKRWLAAKNNREFVKTERYKWERMED